MFAVMPAPIFTFGSAYTVSAAPVDASSSSRYRPSTSSPLSSSPIRSSSSPFASSNHDSSKPVPDTQSSPIQPTAAERPKFRFATRTPRPIPVVRKREDVQESRRRLFLHNVRQRAEDKKWERRGGEQELLKLEWLRLVREWRQAKEAELADFGTDADIEEAARLQQELANNNGVVDEDDLMADTVVEDDSSEIDALLQSLTETDDFGVVSSTAAPAERDPSHSHYASDDEDYDSLFMDLLSSETEFLQSQEGRTDDNRGHEDTEMSGNN
ncbi:hypothetical protein VTK73DRAFT_8048 [Phialemonium thermophilum]|uniref:Uncharacterized protein n=1 Tax=Phialemonium thermophilum TaxID=223376 RepID=A0ABR3WAX7_9PEZI